MFINITVAKTKDTVFLTATCMQVDNDTQFHETLYVKQARLLALYMVHMNIRNTWYFAERIVCGIYL